MRLVLVIGLAGLALPLTVSAQAGEGGATSEPSVEEPTPSPRPAPEEPAPTSEPAPEEPALELKLDDAGVKVVPSPRRTPDGYTLEDMERRVKRAKIGLGVSAGVYGLGLGLAFASAACDDEPAPGEIDIFPACSTALITTGSVLVIGGAVGMILSGVRLARSKRDRDSLRRAHYRTSRRVQWDLARSRLVF